MPVEDFQNTHLPKPIFHSQRANATLLMLARNSDTDGAVRSVRELEDRFNRKYGYPWTFLNEEPFNDEFKKYATQLTFKSLYSPLWIGGLRKSRALKSRTD